MTWGDNRIINKLTPDMPEKDGADATEVNSASDLVGEDGEEDDSPLITQLGLKHNGLHTDIMATIPASNGYAQKRIVIPGGVTAKRLGALLLDVSKW